MIWEELVDNQEVKNPFKERDIILTGNEINL